MTETPPDAIHTKIQNALAILHTEVGNAPASAHQGMHLTIEALVAAAAAVTELEAELDLVTAPELDTARELQRLKHNLETTERRLADLQQKLSAEQDRRQLEASIHQEEHQRLVEIERRAKDFESLLEADDATFGKFMDRALDKEPPQGS